MDRFRAFMRSYWLPLVKSVAWPILWIATCIMAGIPRIVSVPIIFSAVLGGLALFGVFAFNQAKGRDPIGPVRKMSWAMAWWLPLILTLGYVGHNWAKSVGEVMSSAHDNSAQQSPSLMDVEKMTEEPRSVVVQKEPKLDKELGEKPLLLYDEVERWLNSSCYDPSEGWRVLNQKKVAWTLDRIKAYHFPAISFALLPSDTHCGAEIVGKLCYQGLELGFGKQLDVVDSKGAKYYLPWYGPTRSGYASSFGSSIWLLLRSNWDVEDGSPGLEFDVAVGAEVPDKVRKTRLVLEKRFESSDLDRLVHVCTLPKEILGTRVLYDLHVAFYPAMRPGTRVMDATSLSEEQLLPSLFAPQAVVKHSAAEDTKEVYSDFIPSNGQLTVSVENFRRLAFDYLRRNKVADDPSTEEDESAWDGGGELFVYVPKYAPEGKPVLVTCRVALAIRGKPPE